MKPELDRRVWLRPWFTMTGLPLIRSSGWSRRSRVGTMWLTDRKDGMRETDLAERPEAMTASLAPRS